MLSTQLERNGQPISLDWRQWHILRLHDAMILETMGKEKHAEWLSGDVWPEELPPVFPKSGEWVFKLAHSFEDYYEGEIFNIFPGDIYRAWR